MNRLIRALLIFGSILFAFEFITPPSFPCNQLYLYAFAVTLMIMVIDYFIPSVRIEVCDKS